MKQGRQSAAFVGVSSNRGRGVWIVLATVLVASAALSPGGACVAQTPPIPSAASETHQRLLPLKGGQNFRDLGGYRTSDGRMVRWGLLFRSGSMHFLTPEDYAYLEKLGIRTVCDFRDTHERTNEPVVWPAGAPPQVLADDYALTVGPVGAMAPGRTPTAEDARATLAAVYPRLLVQLNSQYRRMFDELLAGHAPLAFNCTAGKDRTGVAAALLLTALGVPRQTVVDDYMLTNRYFDPSKVVHGDPQASKQWRSLPPEVLKAYMAADPSYIDAVFRVMDAHPGGVSGYLRDEFGLTPDKISTLRRLYTEPVS